jgi:hypothetical protein
MTAFLFGMTGLAVLDDGLAVRDDGLSVWDDGLSANIYACKMLPLCVIL